MKVFHVVTASVLLGALAGAGISGARFAGALPALLPAPSAETAIGEAQPKLLVDHRLHDFGPVERDTKVRHVFHFTNIGQDTLTLKAGATTCTKCTIAELSRTQVAPGETVDVTVEYLTSYAQPKFRQTATVLTNDPEQRRVDLNIFGTVTTKFRMVPDHLILSKVSTNETQTAEIKIYSYLSDDVNVVDHAFMNPETAAFFQIQSETLPRETLTEPKAKSGCRVELTVKPGLPLGPIRQTIRLDLRMRGSEENTPVEVPISGIVVSDISMVGPGWNADLGKLSLGAIPSATGATRNVFLLVRGEHRHETAFEPIHVDPAWLKVTLGKPTELNHAVTQIPLSIEIPGGLPPAVYLGSKQGKSAEILLEVQNHPQIHQIRMDVQFVIE